MFKVQRYGYRPSLGDARDQQYAAPANAQLAGWVDNRNKGPEVYDQMNLGSCTANGLCAQYDFLRLAQGKQFLNASRLFLYFFERNLEGTAEVDAGAEPRHGIWVLKGDGLPAESDWPYDDGPDKFRRRPPQSVLHNATANKISNYVQLAQDNSYHLRHALSGGHVFGLGFAVPTSFEDNGHGSIAETGIWNPNVAKEEIVGGHYTVIVGYALNEALPRTLENGAVLQPLKNDEGWALVRNSWGKSWGLKGHFYVPIKFVLNSRFSGDNWMLTS